MQEQINQSEDILAEQQNQYQNNQQLSRNQKIAIGGLAVFAFFVLILYGVYMQQTISGQFDYSDVEVAEETTDGLCTGANCQKEDSEVSLRSKDTDGDGLSDWDELNVYLTSPYLEDSDSDGYPDKKEIDTENDPNCPIGRDCYGVTEESTIDSTVDTTDSTINTSNNSTNIYNTGTTGESSGEGDYSEIDFDKVMAGNSDVDTIRALLITSGLDQSVVDGLTDEEIMDIYDSVVNDL